MATDWRRLTREAGLRLQDGAITVRFDDGRSHLVFADDEAGDGRALRLWSVAAKPSALDRAQDPNGSQDPNLAAWQRNRASDLVGFKIDHRSRLIGEAWVPVAGLTAEEWGLYVRTVARVCDRMEYLLTGRDDY